MRRGGVNLPKYEIKEAVKWPLWSGELVIMDVRDDGVNRQIKVAKHTKEVGGQKSVDVLYDPQIVWMNEGRFTIAGFERVQDGERVVHYAQSWLCILEAGQVTGGAPSLR